MSNSQKISPLKTLAEFSQGAARDNTSILGKVLPCHVVKVEGAIITVKFDVLPGDFNIPEVKIPLSGAEYIRYPIQVGDKGIALAASVSIRDVSGLGVGLPDMSTPPSLTALVFHPISNVDWIAFDPDQVTIHGPKGVLLQTTGADSSINIEPGKISITAADIYLNGIIHLNGLIVQDADQMTSGTTARLIGPVHVENDVTASNISTIGHTHEVKGIQTGSGTVTSEKPNK
ncbi:MAG: phage baseplate protein [Serratia sp. (in: enterobacteria)]|uniref:phage baseplate protein n=1 Tax=Serratia sp. (in: enterobacteria) TaxID=616 RepID=UPI003F32C2DB